MATGKGPTIPKKFWVKGKSKHLYIRLKEEGFSSINDFYKKLSFFKRLLNYFKKICKKI